MQLYTCCPDNGCGAFQESLSFLHSYGIEPSIECDDDGHYFDFKIPKKLPNREEFILKLSAKTGSPICQCGKFFAPKGGGKTYLVEHRESKIKYSVCASCIEDETFRERMKEYLK